MYKIGEVCRLADVQPYVLRYWETEFPALAPEKSGGGQRVYSQREIDVILRIKELLYTEGFTIAGAKKKLEGELNERLELQPAGEDPLAPQQRNTAATTSNRKAISLITKELREILAMLDGDRSTRTSKRAK